MLVAFVPVLHKGYIEFFKKYPKELGILGRDIIADYTSLTRDLRTLDPEDMKQAIEALHIFQRLRVLHKTDLPEIGRMHESITMPDEDISRDLAEKHFPKQAHFEYIFLRWDKPITTAEHIIPPDRVISSAQLHRDLMQQVESEAAKSSDWWRQNGTVILRGEKILSHSHNSHLPTDWHLAQNGDPRVNFDAGQRYDLSTAIHAEAAAIADAAKRGISLEGADLYCTTFPCPPCARLICASGIKRVYYQKGYSLLDSEAILKSYGIEIILVTSP